MTTESLFVIPSGVQTRWASPENFGAEKGAACAQDDGRKRSAWFRLPAGESRDLLHLKQVSGVVRRIWVTIDDRSPSMLRGLRLDLYWDGAAQPAVSAPLGDFFGFGLGRLTRLQSSLFTSPEGRSFTCYVPMPFRQGARIVVTNESGRDLGMLFFDVDCTLGDQHPPDVAYFHAHWRRENPTRVMRDYELLPRVVGRGRFLGVNVGVIANTQRYFRSWWGEGEVKIFLDGDTDHATLCGTGTEDYIGTGWTQGQYSDQYQGCHIADHDHFQYCFYRLHVPDPVWFHSDIRATIQQIGCWDPESLPKMHAAGEALQLGQDVVDLPARIADTPFGIYEREDDWSSCAWFYLDRPENGLPALAPVAERIAGLP
ncbi:MAG: DUF2961 domain-containing protein [Anaerolineales bacterium]|nr:DUF2961 domain-containing protein [Anaerolineales bacterium]